MQIASLTRQFKLLVSKVITAPFVGKLIARTFNDRIPVRNFRFSTNYHAIKPSTKARLFWGIYEITERKFVEQYLDPDKDVLELGANLGFITCVIGKKLHPESRLISVEANPKILPLLFSNIKQNLPNRKIEIVHRAIDYTNIEQKSVSFFIKGGLHSSKVSIKKPGTVEVPTITLSQLIEDYSVTGDYQLIMDIEGAETGIFLKEGRLTCNSIIAELHACRFEKKDYSVEDLIQIIHDRHGFDLTDRRGNVCFFKKNWLM